jgi:uncharacterized protein YjiS (DUF1127 family)
VASLGLDQEKEAEMGHTETHTARNAATGYVPGQGLKIVAALVSAFRSRRLAARRRRTLASMTPEQLDDVALSAPPRRVQVVKAGLITNLMSMR